MEETRYVTVTVKIQDERLLSVTGTDEHGNPDAKHGMVASDARQDEVIRILRDMVREDRLAKREEFELLGACLFDKLFQGDARPFLAQQINKIPEGKVLRLVLELDKQVRELGELPWEFLNLPNDLCPGRSGFVASMDKLVLSRRVAGETKLNPGRRPVQILLGVASPAEHEGPTGRIGMPNPVDVTDLITMLKGLDDGENFSVRVVLNITRDELVWQLNHFKPQVVHLAAHGRYGGKGSEIALCATGEPTLADWYPDKSMADLFQESSAAVVFLQSCSSGFSDSFESFRGMALRLVTRGIPAVVAMSFDIDIPTATDFAQHFYEGLAGGLAVDHAVQKGRRHVAMSNKSSTFYSVRAFGCPVAFVQVGQSLVLGEPTNTRNDDTGEWLKERGGLECPRCLKAVSRRMRLCLSCKTELQVCPNCGEMAGANPPQCPYCRWPGGSAGAAGSAEPSPRSPLAVVSSVETRERGARS